MCDAGRMPSDFDPHKIKDLVRRLEEALRDAAKVRDEVREGLNVRRRRDKGNQSVPRKKKRKVGEKP